MPGTGEKARPLGRFAGCPVDGAGDAVVDELGVARGVPLAAGIVVSQDGCRLACLILQTECQIDLGKAGKRFRYMVGGLEVVDNALEASDRGLIQVLLLVE